MYCFDKQQTINAFIFAYLYRDFSLVLLFLIYVFYKVFLYHKRLQSRHLRYVTHYCDIKHYYESIRRYNRHLYFDLTGHRLYRFDYHPVTTSPFP